MAADPEHAEALLNLGVLAKRRGNLVAAEGRSVFITGGLECAEIAALNGTVARLRSVLSALEARVSTLEAGASPIPCPSHVD